MVSLKMHNVNKAYGKIHAVKDLNLAIQQGDIFGLLGPNGAGKTTAIRMIMDILRPDSGYIEIFGKPNSATLRDEIGYLPEERGLYKKMNVFDVISFFAEIKSVPQKEIPDRASNLLQKLDLLDWRDKKVEELSRGMQQKLQFICTVIHEPKLIILDEPFTGLDPVNTRILKDMMLDMKAKGTTIIFSTHLMEQVEKLCESICLINRGESILRGKVSDIKTTFGKNRVRMSYEGKADFLTDPSYIASYDDYGQYVEIQLAEGVSSQELLKNAMQKVAVQHFEIADPSLNEIFISTVKSEGNNHA